MAEPITTTARMLIADELQRARRGWAKNPSLAHGLSILAEEVDEFWDLVKINQNKHDYREMILELTQIAAMAHRAWEDAFGGDLWLIEEVVPFVTPHDTAWWLRRAMINLARFDDRIDYWLVSIVANCEAAIDALREAVKDE